MIVFGKNDISKFLCEAPDEIYLVEKVALIFGIVATLRRGEFTEICVKDVKKLDNNVLLVQILKTKNNVPRSFTITDVLYDICLKYLNARSEVSQLDRFFLRYLNGKCILQSIGINKFASIAKFIAEYLKLPNANMFSGHSFRRTSATLLVDAGADFLTLQRHGGWKSAAVASGYIADSINNKTKIFHQISSGIEVTKKVKISHDSSALADSHTTNSEITTPSTSKDLQRTNLFRPFEKRSTVATNPVYTMNQSASNSKFEKESVVPTNTNYTINQSESKSKSLSESNENIIKSQTNMYVREDPCILKNSFAYSETSKSPVLYHPDIGLYLQGSIDQNLNNNFVFNNCNVTINNNKCSIMLEKAVQTQDTTDLINN